MPFALVERCGETIERIRHVARLHPQPPKARIGEMDRITPEQRSRNMRAVRSKDSEIELRLRRALWAAGLRYRKHYTKVPGKPDIAFVSARLAIFCDSEFWHGYDWEHRQHDFKSNREFWLPKIERNIRRDAEVNRELESLGWRVVRFWGHEIEHDPELCVETVLNALEERRKR